MDKHNLEKKSPSNPETNINSTNNIFNNIIFSNVNKNKENNQTIFNIKKEDKVSLNSINKNLNNSSINVSDSEDNLVKRDNNIITKEGISSCDQISLTSYFDFYSKISNQQNMLQDLIRTQTYRNAIFSNEIDFKNKLVMDVGTGSGILAIFSAQAGAKHVYAVEASSSAYYAKLLFKNNNLEHKITLINKPIDVNIDLSDDIKEKVDTLISEPLGILLVNERMLETYLLARDFYLKPGGKMFPSSSVMHFTPFSDEGLYNEQCEKVKFWMNNNFFNVDLSGLYEAALKEKMSQPVIENYNPNTQ